MRLRGFGLLPALLSLAAPLSGHEKPPQAAKAGALPVSARGAGTAVDAFHAALDRGDTRTAASLLADDALIFESGGAERSKA